VTVSLDPEHGSAAARSGDAKTMLRIYEKHLATQQASEEMDELTASVSCSPNAPRRG
jgi:hypothetical protein